MKFDLKERCKSYSFWLAIASAVFLLIQAIGKPLGLEVSEEVYMSIINAVLGIFVVFGIISDPTKNIEEAQTDTDSQENAQTEGENNNNASQEK